MDNPFCVGLHGEYVVVGGPQAIGTGVARIGMRSGNNKAGNEDQEEERNGDTVCGEI